MEIRFRSVDTKQQIVEGLVYEPHALDTYCEAMLPEDIEVMAHRFMRLDLSKVVDYQHDNVLVNAHPVESWIVRHDHPHYSVGSWVVSMKVEDAAVWKKIEAGEINAFSFEAMVKAVKAEVTFGVTRDQLGFTEPAEDGHRHAFYVRLGEDGNVVEGRTSEVNGHFHEIKKSSTTARSDGHNHRYFLG